MNGNYSLSKFRCISYLIVAIFMVCTILVAQEKEPADTITVTATGIGHNTDEALKDAFKNAVRRAVGVYVLTETTMNTNEEIDEKVYANADATINSHTVIDTKTLPNNLVNITIKAEVLKGVIGQKINKGKTTEVNKMDIVNVTNHLDAMEEAQKSLDLLFKDFPACLLSVETIGQPIIDESRDATQEFIPMRQELRISIDYHKYEQFVEKLMKLFNSLGYKKGKKVNLSNENFISFARKDEYQNCICIITRKNPKIRSLNIQDLNCQIYRLPGQIARYMKKYVKRIDILHYRLLDVDNNVLAEKELYNNPCFCVCERYFGLSSPIDNSFHYYFATSVVADHNNMRVLICPLFSSQWISDLSRIRSEPYTLAFSFKLFLPLQVKKQLYKNAEELKINVSIHNKEDDNLVIP